MSDYISSIIISSHRVFFFYNLWVTTSHHAWLHSIVCDYVTSYKITLYNVIFTRCRVVQIVLCFRLAIARVKHAKRKYCSILHLGVLTYCCSCLPESAVGYSLQPASWRCWSKCTVWNAVRITTLSLIARMWNQETSLSPAMESMPNPSPFTSLEESFNLLLGATHEEAGYGQFWFLQP